MRLRRRPRWLATLAALMSMLFMQLAVAAYACPTTGLPIDSASGIAAAPVAKDKAKGNCQEIDQAQPNLCAASSNAGYVSLDKPEIPQLPSLAAASYGHLLFSIAPTLPTDSARPVLLGTHATATSPPITIRHCCFRI